MSPYERQIDPLESVDVDYVLGVPGQATPSAQERLEVLYTPPSAQRIGTSADTAATLRDLLGEIDDTAITEVNVALEAGLESRLGAGLGNRLFGLEPRIGLRVGGAALVLAALLSVAAAISLAGGGSDGPSADQIARANGAATAQVLAQDLGVGLGAYAADGLPVTLTNTADAPLAYNVTVEALDAAGRRVTADAAFVGTLAPGQSTVVTLFATAEQSTATALAASTFRVVEASSY